MAKRVEIKIVGVGGQGVVLAGQILGMAAVFDGWHATQTQSYGARVRGTPVFSDVIMSDERVRYPFTRRIDVLIAMEKKMVEENLKLLKSGAIVIADGLESTSRSDVKVFNVEASKKSMEIFGSKLHANMIMLGAFSKITELISLDSIIKAVREASPPNLAEKNIEAVKVGWEVGEKIKE